jgi:hypothetical protein
MPNMVDPGLKADASEGRDTIESWFGPPKRPIDPNVADGQQIDSETLATAYVGNNVQMGEYARFAFETGDGWWTVLCPPRRTGMNESWTIWTSNATAMEPAPEDTAPRYVSYQVEGGSAKLTRFALGTHEHHDFFKTPEGRKAMEVKIATVVAGGWISAKLLVEEAIITGPSYHREWLRQYGKAYTSVKDAQADAVRLWCAFSHHEKAILVINSYIMDTVYREEPRKPNMAVVQPGVLDYILYAFPYWTEASRIGEGGVQRALALGSRALVGLFKVLGVDLYENKTFRINNVPYGQFNALEKTTSIGRYFHVDGNNRVYSRDGSGSLDASASLSFQHASMDVDDWKEMGPATLIKKCMRFSEDGESLSDWMHEFLDNLGATIQSTGFSVDDNLVDPYLWRTGAAPGASGHYPTNEGFALIDVWGDMDVRYRSVDRDLFHGKEASKLVRKLLGDDEARSIERALSLMDRLYNPPALDASTVAFALGTAYLSGNTRNNIVVADSTGAPTEIPVPDENGFLTLAQAGGDPLYVFAFYLDIAGGKAARITADPPLSGDVPLAYVFAAKDTFGNLSAAGAAPDDWSAGLAGAVANFGANINVLKPTAAKNAVPRNSANAYGVLPPRAVRAAALPYGLSTIAGLTKLSKLTDWIGNKEVVEVAQYGVAALDNLWEIVRKLYPACKLFNPAYAPNYVATGNPETDSKYAFLQNVVDHAKLPLWALRTQNPAEFSGLSGVFPAAATEVATAIGGGDVTATDAVATALYDAVVGRAASLGGVSRATLVAFTRALLNSDYLGAEARASIVADNGDSLATYFANSNFGRTYNELRRQETLNPNGDFGNLKSFLENEVAPRVSSEPDTASAVLGGLLNNLALAQAGTVSNVMVTRAWINRLANFNKSRNKRSKAAASGVWDDVAAASSVATAVAPGAFEGDASSWINTRLAIRPELFHGLANRARAGGAAERLSVSIVPVRPGNPENPNSPLAPHIPKVYDTGANGADDADDERANDYIAQLKHARGNPGRAGGFSRLVFAYTPGLYGGSGSASQYGGSLSNKDFMDIDRGSSGFDAGRSHIPQTARFSPDDLLWQEQHYENSLGQPLERVSSFEQRKNLVYRIDQIAALEHEPFARWCAMLLNFTKVNATGQLVWLERGLPIPDSCYTFYQHAIRFKTSASLWAVGGAETGHIGYNWEDAVIQFNGINKTWHVHYTAWLNAVIVQKRNVHLQPDTKYEGYEGGMDDRLYEHPSEFDSKSFEFTKSGFIFSQGSECTREWMLANCNPMPLWGRHQQKTLGPVKLTRDAFISSKKPLWPSFFFYNFVWNFTGLLNSVDLQFGSYKEESEPKKGISGEAYHGSMRLQDSTESTPRACAAPVSSPTTLLPSATSSTARSPSSTSDPKLLLLLLLSPSLPLSLL